MNRHKSKPFPYTPVDIDVLISSKRDLTEASQTLAKRCLKPLDKDLYGSTMLSVDHDLNVDLTAEVTVSDLIYLDKSLLFKHVSRVKVNSFDVQTLQPYADLVTVATHSMYKEQIYPLIDYCTITL